MTPALLLALALHVLPAGRVDRDLVRALCLAEHCRADDVGRVVGPLQVSLAWARPGRLCAGLRLREPWDSVECACRLLARGREECAVWTAAVGWYHTGRCVEDDYARRIMRRWARGRVT